MPKDTILEAIEDIRSHLGIGYGEIGRMLGVPRKTIRAWAFRKALIPMEHVVKINEVHNALLRLLQLIQPDRLPQVIRRPAEAFGGRCALDLIMEGRIKEVAEVFESILDY